MKRLYLIIKNAFDKVFFRFWKKIVRRYANNSFSRIWVFAFDTIMVLLAFICSRLVFKSMGTASSQPLHVLGYAVILVTVYGISFQRHASK